MNDRRFSASVTAVTVGALWLLSITLVLLELFTRFEVGQVGILAAGAAVTLNIRVYFCQMQCREQRAFDLGRESVRLVP